MQPIVFRRYRMGMTNKSGVTGWERRSMRTVGMTGRVEGGANRRLTSEGALLTTVSVLVVLVGDALGGFLVGAGRARHLRVLHMGLVRRMCGQNLRCNT